MFGWKLSEMRGLWYQLKYTHWESLGEEFIYHLQPDYIGGHSEDKSLFAMLHSHACLHPIGSRVHE